MEIRSVNRLEECLSHLPTACVRNQQERQMATTVFTTTTSPISYKRTYAKYEVVLPSSLAKTRSSRIQMVCLNDVRFYTQMANGGVNAENNLRYVCIR